MVRIDLHTHSLDSPDGGLSRGDYERMLANGKLDCIAITDHDSIAFAQELKQKIGDKIIVGEEISAQEGEIIGLFLSEPVSPGLSAAKTVRHIRGQGGLVYVPHPFETVRKGLPAAVLDDISDLIDIVEFYNGRAVFQNKSKQAAVWATLHQKAVAASSDAHSKYGWGRTCTVIKQTPTRDNLVEQLMAATHLGSTVGVRGLLSPKYNRLKKSLK